MILASHTAVWMTPFRFNLSYQTNTLVQPPGSPAELIAGQRVDNARRGGPRWLNEAQLGFKLDLLVAESPVISFLAHPSFPLLFPLPGWAIDAVSKSAGLAAVKGTLIATIAGEGPRPDASTRALLIR